MEGSFGWVAVFAIILAAVNLEAAPRQAVPTVCPSEDSLEETVLLAHESDCSKFYVCFLGEKILKECPYRNSRGDRLHFNPLLQVCDYPLEAGCKLQPIASKQLTTSVAVPLTKQPPSQLTTPHNIPSSISSTNSSNQIKYKEHQCTCNLYYENINNSYILRQCSKDFCWNQDLQTCYRPESIKCMQQRISTTTIMLPFDITCTEGDYVKHECQCTLYYQCKNGLLVLKECPNSLHWNEKSKSCTSKDTANCEKPLCKEGPYKPHPCECNLYYKCVKNDYVLQKCPNGLDWDRRNNACRDPKDAGCRPVSCKDGPYKPHEKDCDKYYKCENGIYVPKTCPSGLHWDRQRNICNKPSEAKCPYPPPPCIEGTTKPHQCECNLYYKCINNDFVLQKCPNGLDWDRRNNACRDPKDAGCRPVSCKDGPYKPHEKDCDKYYKCENGIYVPKTCPSGLHWDRQRNTCNEPSEAKCPNWRICIEGTTKPHACDCNLYYRCINNDYVRKECPAGQDWDRVNEKCRDPKDAGCRPVCKDGPYKPHEKDCDKYYKCDNGIYVPRTCPSGLHWDRQRNICNKPSEAKCPHPPICIEGTTLPHPSECNIYYKCIDNKYVQQKCPNGLDWDRRNNACRDPKDAGCRPVCKDGPYKPHEKDCDKYYKCENGIYVPKTCPSGLHWDRQRNICNKPSEAKCPYPPPPCIEGTTKPHQCECNLYYKCINNDFVLQKCPNGLHWDRRNNACRDPKDAGCRPVSCKDGPYKPHEKDCDKYYTCENGIYVPKTCPSGLHWDRQRNTCNKPSEAKCPYPLPPCIEGSTHPHECQCQLYYKCKNGGLTLQECEVGKEWDRVNHICTDPASANCPKRHPFGCNEGSYKSDDKECNIYYKCISNNYVSKTCTPGLHWNRKRNLCTEPIDARCPTSPINPCPEGFYKPHEKECDKYFKCENNNYVTKTCVSGLHWNRKRNLCTDPTDARCPTSPINPCPEGFYKPHEKECDKYFKCENNNYVTKTCVSGLHWNRKRNLCTDPTDARCPTSPINPCPEGFYKPHEKECDKYFKCENNNYVTKTCIPGLHWNRKHNLCTDPEKANCLILRSESTCVQGSTKHHECECSLYHVCIYDQWILQVCPKGLNWDRKRNICTHTDCIRSCPAGQEHPSGVCVEPENTNSKATNEENIPEVSITDNLLSEKVPQSSRPVYISPNIPGVPDHCPPDDYGKLVHLPHETNCSLFYKCNKGKKILQKCPPGLEFNPVMQICLTPEQSKCTSKPENKVSGNQHFSDIKQSFRTAFKSSRPVYISPNIPGVPDHCPPDDYGKLVHLPHETNCSLFYKCNKGEKILQKCPPGLEFNPVMQICLTPEQSKCTSKPENKVNGNQDLSEIEGLNTAISESSTPGSIPDHCPSHDTGDVVHLPHETDCTLFYKCVEGEKVIQQCPEGLHFNANLQICDLPEHANCTSKLDNEIDGNQDLSEIEGLNTAISESSTPGSIPDHCPSHDTGDVVHLPHETDCTLFYKCVEGEKVIQQCPEGLHFNANLQICDLPEHANCTSKLDNEIDGNQDLSEIEGLNTAISESSTPGSIPDHCPSHDTGDVVHLPHETDCTLFYKCVEGEKVIQQCPEGLHFNANLQICDLPEHANCTSKLDNEIDGNQDLSEIEGLNTAISESSTPGSIPDHCPSHDTGDVVHLPHETDCTLFYKCVEGEKVIQQCPEGLHFNANLQICDLPEHANCTSKLDNEIDGNQDLSEIEGLNTAISESSTPGSIPDRCPSHDTGDAVHLRHETDCTLFYKCVEGIKVLQQCPSGLHFNPALQVCDLPEQANCRSKPDDNGDENQELPVTGGSTSAPPQSSTRIPTSSTPGNIPDHCPSDDNGTVVHLPHETNCSLFYKCHEGKKVVLQCPPHLHFNPALQVCDLPEQANCKSKPDDNGDENQELPVTRGSTSAPSQSSTGIPTSSSPGNIPDRCPSHDTGDVVHLRHETDCTLFYKCVEGNKVLQQCPAGLHFNSALQVCDLPEQANCRSKPGDNGDENQELPVTRGSTSAPPQSSTRIPASSTPGNIPDHCPSDDNGTVVHLPHETNCSLFYKCHEGKKVVLQCPPHLHFNPALQVCDLPEQANCKSKPGDNGDENQELPVTRGSTSAPSQSSTGIPTSSNPGNIPDRCPSHDTGDVVHLRHETDCALFYKCVEGNKVLQQCPAGLHFNSALQVCDLPEQANCKSKPGDNGDENQELPVTRGSTSAPSQSSTGIPTSSSPGNIPDRCPSHDTGDVVHLRHETDCTLFYKCVEGNKVLQQCPAGLHFNPVLEVCDRPVHAKCTN